MDIFAHGLWVGAAARGLNKREVERRTCLRRCCGRQVNVWAMTLWGVFPDLFAFAIPFVWLIVGVLSGNLELGKFGANHPPLAEPLGSSTAFIFHLTSVFYNVGHSMVVFALVFFVIWFFLRRPVWEMGGWLLHILIDVPTHTYAFYPTPVFWPIFDWKFNGFSWATPWFMVLNYSLLLLVYALLARHRTKIGLDDKA